MSYHSDDGTPGKKSPTRLARRQPVTLRLRTMCIQACIEGIDSDIWDENDYAVVDLDINKRVGRMYPKRVSGEAKWLWFLQTEPALPLNSGMADTLDEAKAQFKRRYTEVKGRT
jgi:hypothetical protein